MSDPPTPIDHAALTARTLAWYDASAEWFREGTRDHDVSQNYAALLGAIEGTPPFTLLDLGCGPGRDLAYFRSIGHEAVGLDGCARFVEMARELTGSACEVLHQDFGSLSLPIARFDGVFANATLFHVPPRDLARVLGEVRRALVPRGVLFCSNPRGEDTEGFSNGRYGAFHTLETWRGHVTAAGFREIGHYFRPEGRPRRRPTSLSTSRLLRLPRPISRPLATSRAPTRPPDISSRPIRLSRPTSPPIPAGSSRTSPATWAGPSPR